MFRWFQDCIALVDGPAPPTTSTNTNANTAVVAIQSFIATSVLGAVDMKKILWSVCPGIAAVTSLFSQLATPTPEAPDEHSTVNETQTWSVAFARAFVASLRECCAATGGNEDLIDASLFLKRFPSPLQSLLSISLSLYRGATTNASLPKSVQLLLGRRDLVETARFAIHCIAQPSPSTTDTASASASVSVASSAARVGNRAILWGVTASAAAGSSSAASNHNSSNNNSSSSGQLSSAAMPSSSLSAVNSQEDDGLEAVNSMSIIRFPDDDRVQEAARILRSSRSLYLRLDKAPEMSDMEHREKLQAKLTVLCRRYCMRISIYLIIYFYHKLIDRMIY